MSLLCRSRHLRVLRVVSGALALVVWWSISDSAAQQIRVVPSISVTERYDSNVFFTPESFLPAGTKVDDLITTITPQLNFIHGNTLVKTNLSVGAIIQKFVNNSALDNVGFNGSAGIDLSQAVNRMLPRMRGFRIMGTYLYTPSAPAFGAGGLGGGAGMGGGGGFGAGGIGLMGPIDSGLITQRIRTTMFSVGFSNSYSLSPTTDFQTSYMYSQLSFGGSFTPSTTVGGQPSNTVFDTTTHTISAGPTSRISAIDSLSMKYTFTQMSQPQFGDYATHGATLGWGRTWSKEWSSSATGGLTLIEPIPDTSSSGGQRRIPATMFPTGSVSLSYAAGSSFLRKLGSEIQETTGGSPTAGAGFLPLLAGMNMPGGIAAPGSYRLTLMYNLGVFPSFVQAAGPIYTHSIMLGSMAGITDRLSAQALFNFARSTFTSDAIGTTFTTYGTTVSLNYLIAPMFTANLSHQWLMFDSQSQSNGLNAADLGFAKQVILLGFTYAYSPRGDFFRSGAFWEGSSGGSSSAESGLGKSGSGGVDTKK